MSFYRHIALVLATIISLCSAQSKDFTVVIDPGHGGHDYGAIGRITNEKSINLAVAKLLGKKIDEGMPDVKVVYTRDNDSFISLSERANRANRAKGDLFISIHVNSVDRRSKNRTTVAGAEIYTLGLHKSEENLAVAKRENSVMELEADYSETYSNFDPNSVESYIIFELNQSKHIDQSIDFASKTLAEMTSTGGRADKGVRQAGFWVLWATSMPAVLVELDFICNPASERFLNSESGQDKLAQALYNALKQYRDGTGSTTAHPDASQQNQPQEAQSRQPVKVTTTPSGEIEYRIQIMASDEAIPSGSPRFKGTENVFEYHDRGMYKYTIGIYPSFDAAKRNLRAARRKFPEAFIIKMKDGHRVYE